MVWAGPWAWRPWTSLCTFTLMLCPSTWSRPSETPNRWAQYDLKKLSNSSNKDLPRFFTLMSSHATRLQTLTYAPSRMSNVHCVSSNGVLRPCVTARCCSLGLGYIPLTSVRYPLKLRNINNVLFLIDCKPIWSAPPKPCLPVIIIQLLFLRLASVQSKGVPLLFPRSSRLPHCII